MNRTIEIAPLRKSVVVEATPAQAFAVFTSGIDRWWPKTHGIGQGPVRESVIEPFVGGRWYARHEDDSIAVVGHVLVWQPGERLVVSWEISAEWKPDPTGDLYLRSRRALQRRSRRRYARRARAPQLRAHGRGGRHQMRGDVSGGWPTILELFAKEASRTENKS